MAGRKQFDVDTALDRALELFWEQGYADTSLDQLGAATGLGRGSFYGAFGDKSTLFRQCLDRYSAGYGARYERALTAYPDEPVRAVQAFFDVALDRIADPTVPDGCLIAQSAAQAPVLNPSHRARVQELLDVQRTRVRAALSTPDVDAADLDDLATYVVAVNQSLAVMSRAGTPVADLRSVVRITCKTIADALGQQTTDR